MNWTPRHYLRQRLITVPHGLGNDAAQQCRDRVYLITVRGAPKPIRLRHMPIGRLPELELRGAHSRHAKMPQ